MSQIDNRELRNFNNTLKIFFANEFENAFFFKNKSQLFHTRIFRENLIKFSNLQWLWGKWNWDLKWYCLGICVGVEVSSLGRSRADVRSSARHTWLRMRCYRDATYLYLRRLLKTHFRSYLGKLYVKLKCVVYRW